RAPEPFPFHSAQVPLVKALLPRVAAGDPAAVQECLGRYGALVWSLARRYFADRTEAEDAVQDVFIQLWKKAGSFDPTRGGEASFVGVIARRRCVDRIRRGARRKEVTAEVHDEATAAPSAEEQSIRGEEAARAATALAALPEGQRQVLEMSVCRGMTQAQVAEALGMPLGTVKTHARRGLQRLRQSLQSESVAPPLTKEGGAA
ncbi:MAG TPA: sigma-70 family RNA polymerase sigma factor, partial [Planctomycetota bacterium]